MKNIRGQVNLYFDQVDSEMLNMKTIYMENIVGSLSLNFLPNRYYWTMIDQYLPIAFEMMIHSSAIPQNDSKKKLL